MLMLQPFVHGDVFLVCFLCGWIYPISSLLVRLGLDALSGFSRKPWWLGFLCSSLALVLCGVDGGVAASFSTIGSEL